jgi:transposase
VVRARCRRALGLTAFYAAYRADGHGRAAHDPAMMVALVLYAYAVGERSSCGIERRCVEDVGFRVVAANQAPDHTTINRFRARHQDALADPFGEVLGLCARAGAVSVGVIALDATRMRANAADSANHTYEQLAREILEEAAAVDAAEDERYGEARGDELPPNSPTRPRAGPSSSRRATGCEPIGRPSSASWPTGSRPRPTTPPAPGVSWARRPSRARCPTRRPDARI